MRAGRQIFLAIARGGSAADQRQLLLSRSPRAGIVNPSCQSLMRGCDPHGPLTSLRIPVRLASVLVLLLVVGCRTSAFLVANVPAAFEHVDRHLDIAYGRDRRQQLDVYAPRRAVNRPVVVFWYGGSWTEGSKADYRFVGATLATRGLVAVLPDYRLFPQVTFPLFDEDGARAVAWVEQHIREFGGDPCHIVLMGHSAGGHTAAFLAYNHVFLQRLGADPRCISGLVGLSGTYVLVPETATERAAFPAPATARDWQPVRFVDGQAPPTLLFHGLDDKEILPEESIELRDTLLRNHVRVELRLLPHRGHGDTVAPFALVARWRSPVVEETVRFVESVTRDE
jgi:acetyl esterase/lipase